MSREMPTAENLLKAQEMLGSKEASMSEIRENKLEKVKAESGLDGATFDEMANSFNSEYLGIGYTKFSFGLRGHEVTGFLTSGPDGKGVSQVQIDKAQVTGDKFQEFWKKYEAAIVGLDSITVKTAEREANEQEVDDLLK